uniref:MARVEL domain-containing protein n=1 Tax=Rhabditophanes sp. KR3021 TaxID=114890 RepID=A0AC35UB87_9BILA
MPNSSERIIEVIPFCYNDPKYKCLKKVHIKVATYIITTLLCILFVIGAVGAWATQTHIILSIGASVVAGVCILTTGLLIFGSKKEKQLLFLPYLGFGVVGVGGLVALAVVCVLSIVYADSEPVRNVFYPNHTTTITKEQHTGLITNAAILIAISLVLLFVTIWALILSFRTYKFMGDILFARRPANLLKREEEQFKKKEKF